MSVINHKDFTPKVVAGRLRTKKKMIKKPPHYLLWLVSSTATISLLFVLAVGVLLVKAQLPPIIRSPEKKHLLLPPPTRSFTRQSTQEIVPTSLPTDVPQSAESNFQIVPTVTLSPTPNLKLITAIPVATTTAIANDGEIAVFHIDTPFQIDGDLNGWSNLPPYPSLFTVFSREDWDGSDDIEVYWRLAWDETKLYLAAVIIDDIHAQMQTGKFIFLGDSLELQIDTQPTAQAIKLNRSTYQLILSPGDFALLLPSSYFFQATTQGQMSDATPQTPIELSALPTTNGYVLEAAIAWHDLGFTPSADAILGITLNVNDNDSVGMARQEVMKSQARNREYSNPSTWGRLRLKDQP